jgi:hypothetical protein
MTASKISVGMVSYASRWSLRCLVVGVIQGRTATAVYEGDAAEEDAFEQVGA